MPITMPNGLPAKDLLEREHIFAMPFERAETQDIRPLEIAILNLMPTKIETETQLVRLLSNTPLQVHLTLLAPASYTPKHTPAEHMLSFYTSWDNVKEKNFDGLIVTGAPVEHLPWGDVAYWDELTAMFDWSREHVHSSLFICWGAQAALQHFHGISKHTLEEKRFGVFPHRVALPHATLLRGSDDVFPVPVARYTEVRREDVLAVDELEILAESEESGLHIVCGKNRREVFVFNHPEYDTLTLKKEYERNVSEGLNPPIPKYYFPDDDPTRAPRNTWRAHGHLLYANWLNYFVYQEAPYNLEDINPARRLMQQELFLMDKGESALW